MASRSSRSSSSPRGGFLISETSAVAISALRGFGTRPCAARSATCLRYSSSMVSPRVYDFARTDPHARFEAVLIVAYNDRRGAYPKQSGRSFVQIKGNDQALNGIPAARLEYYRNPSFVYHAAYSS
ncbi:protein of unknown function [Methylocaldum szegediense]|uniref:Uncharacterized protein n=1 Tax=Methylocaldum szegediense TaxID=73780 RepID=A0ABM9HXA8_9GAMM|nr:protein of unknown function [Methylocaldum szegediense]